MKSCGGQRVLMVQVLEALQRKIARERIGAEIAGCFDGPQPLQAAAYLLQIQAFPIVFQVLYHDLYLPHSVCGSQKGAAQPSIRGKRLYCVYG